MPMLSLLRRPAGGAWLPTEPNPFAASLLMGICLAAVPIFAQSPKSEPDQGTWYTAAPLPTKRTEAAVATLGGKIYVVGGFQQVGTGNAKSSVITSSLEVYDPVTDRWTSKASLPTRLHHAGIGVAGGRLYVIGGYTWSWFSIWKPVTSVYVYDPAMDRWTERASMPTARGALAVTEHDGKLYAIGGYDQDANRAEVEVYDPLRDAWETRAPLPTPRDHLATAAASGKIYAIGGRVVGHYGRNLAVVETYDPSLDRWTRGSDLPTARSGITAAVLDGKIFVFGGEGMAGTFRENEVYDPPRDSWHAMAPMPTARHGLGSASVGGRIYVISGGPTPGGSFSDANEVFVPPSETGPKPR